MDSARELNPFHGNEQTAIRELLLSLAIICAWRAKQIGPAGADPIAVESLDF